VSSNRPATYPPLDPNTVLWSSTPTDPNSDLLIMMHGWGYDERHLFAFRPDLPEQLTIASLRAPLREAGGYAWFPSSGNPIGNPRPAVANAAVDAVLDWLDTLPRFRTVGVMGFSQGGAMALQLMRRRPPEFDYAVQLGGFVVADEQPGDGELARRRPPVFWGRGAWDGVIPDAAIARTSWFAAHHLAVEEHVYSNLGHDVAGQEVVDLCAFVADILDRPRS